MTQAPRDTRAPSVLGVTQPPVTAQQLEQARGGLLRYRIMAFVTGVVLIAGCISLIFKYGTSVDVEPWTGYLWVAHGWLFVIYVLATAYLGIKLRWPLARYGLVMLAGTIPTMSFVAEHFVTRDARKTQPSDAA
ncbi:DUF3817 domain-containing protein [uncultured Jatrophihabitans sp.]|uniref:DUF3817 domain-containing protein n=1 Tax=uncultured Jatrophihabitans sp. TaxID=1610747 RepID=UPI0035CB1AE0